MAIQGNYNFKGLSLENVYVRIDEIHGGKVLNGWRGVANVYLNRDMTPYDGSVSNSFGTHEVSGVAWVDDINPYPALYAKLKQLPQFKDFVDV